MNKRVREAIAKSIETPKSAQLLILRPLILECVPIKERTIEAISMTIFIKMMSKSKGAKTKIPTAAPSSSSRSENIKTYDIIKKIKDIAKREATSGTLQINLFLKTFSFLIFFNRLIIFDSNILLPFQIGEINLAFLYAEAMTDMFF